ncbi:hypothetical protein GCM10007905_13480 [Mixta theicola]|nr:hypothetical protein GCM10007905_13480 [Mixta theicola]
MKAIRGTLDKYVDYKNLTYSQDIISLLNNAISKTRLPKFNSTSDNANGLGITVHDIYSVKIEVLALEFNEKNWQVRLRYRAQDHFGLDDNDIMQKKFHQFNFFRIWFVLQRFEKFGFKPFFTNMSAGININGENK